MSVRVRFAPSPTGSLHLGGARTALFNWLFARHHKGKFILRIEDTDRERSTLEANHAIFDGLEWLGIDWDEGPNVDGLHGPYYQTERLLIYKKHIQQLIDEGKAYYCYCTPKELAIKRKQAAERKEAPRYDGACRKLAHPPKDKSAVVRFMLPPIGKTLVDDLVHGEVNFENELLDDFVILKSDGFPTYNFACVVDDHLMEISHVIRGDDHLSNTPRQILLYHAFGWKLPKFAHIPMILGSDKTRLSKRHGATSLVAYGEMGYLPEAMLNYLARLGWAHGDQEVFSREELIEKFSLGKITKSSAIFDMEKLNWLNGQYIRKSLPERIADLCLPFIEKVYGKQDIAYLNRVIKICQDRLKVIVDIVPYTKYFFVDEYEMEEATREKYLKDTRDLEILDTLNKRLSMVEPFTKENIEKVFKDLAKESQEQGRGQGLGTIIHPCRAALTGRSESPPIYDVVEVLGRERVISRLSKIR